MPKSKSEAVKESDMIIAVDHGLRKAKTRRDTVKGEDRGNNVGRHISRKSEVWGEKSE